MPSDVLKRVYQKYKYYKCYVHSM